MSYVTSTKLKIPMDDAVLLVTSALKEQGFGILTEIDVKATLKAKIGVDFRDYRILGACNPHFAHKALQAEDMIGAMLPCNVVVQDRGNGEVEVSAVDPVASMMAVQNDQLGEIASEVRQQLKDVIESL